MNKNKNSDENFEAQDDAQMSESEKFDLNQNLNPELEPDQLMQDQTSDKHLEDENNSESNFFIIQNDQQSDEFKLTGKETLVQKPSKEHKIILDPTLLHDEDMHGGVDRIMSTILKSKSSVSEESNEGQMDSHHEEHIEQDMEESGVDKPDVDMQIDNQSSDGTKIKIRQSCTKPIGIKEEDIEKMDPEYGMFLENMVKSEFYQLQREIEQKENKRKELRKYKKYINFMHILQKRIKK